MTGYHDVQTLFSSETLSIEEFRCSGQSAHIGEESALRHEIVLPRIGAYIRKDATGTVVATVNQLLLFHTNAPYEIDHPVSGGDVSTVFAISRRALLGLIREFDPSVDDRPDQPFPKTYTMIDPRCRLILSQLLLMTARSSYDPLEVEERCLTTLAYSIQPIFDHRRFRSQSMRADTRSAHHEIANQVKVILSEGFSSKLQLSQLADAIHASPYTLCRIFKRETGLSIHQYLRRLRLLNGLERLLERRKEPIAAIALDVGFANHSHFSTTFMDAFDMTPVQFRRNAAPRRLREMSKILKV
jgi:AraC-like DNA-binding protein